MFDLAGLAQLTGRDPDKLPHVILWDNWKSDPLVDSRGRLHLNKKWMAELNKHFELKFIANFGRKGDAKRYQLVATGEMLINMVAGANGIGILPDATGDSAKRNIGKIKIPRARGILLPTSKIN